MAKWKYKTITLDPRWALTGMKVDFEGITRELNEYGAEGWELVNIIDTGKSLEKGKTLIVFKCPELTA